MYRSVCILVLFAFSISALTLVAKEKLDDVEEKCIGETKINQAQAKRLHNNPEDLFRDPSAKCYVACVLRERGSVKADGTLNHDEIVKQLPDDLAELDKIIQAFAECSHEQGDEFCDTAYKTSICVMGKKAIRTMRPRNS